MDALADAAQEMSIEVGRGQVRRILLSEGVRWCQTQAWAQSPDPEFAPKGRGSADSTPIRHPTQPLFASTSLGLLLCAPSLLLRDGRRTDTASKRHSNTAAAGTRDGSSAPCESRTSSRSLSPPAPGAPRAT